MLILTNSDQSLQVLLSGAVAANECPIVVSYGDVESGQRGAPTKKTVNTITTGATAVSAVAGPRSGLAREVHFFSLHNADTSAVTVTVRLNDDGTTRTVFKGTLETLEGLLYSPERGWYAVEASAGLKTNTAGTSGSTSQAESVGTSAGLAASVVLSKAVSYDTAEDVTVSVADSKAESAALKGSVVLSSATSLDTATDVTVSTALSTGTSAGLAASVVQSNDTRTSTDQSTMRSLLASGGQAGF